MKRTAVVGTPRTRRPMAQPVRPRRGTRHPVVVTVLLAIGALAMGLAAWKTAHYALALHDPLTGVVVSVLGVLGLVGAWASVHEIWRPGR